MFGAAVALIHLASMTHGGEHNPPHSTVLTYEVSGDGGYITIPVTIKGKEYSFVVDTGCTVSALDKTLEYLLDGPSSSGSVRLTNTEEIMTFRSAPKMVSKGVVLCPEAKVWIADLAPLRKASAQECYGIIGMDCLKAFTIVIDMSEQRLYLCDNESHKKSDNPMVPANRITYSDLGQPQIECEIGTKRHLFMLDSGESGSGSIDGDTARSIKSTLFESAKSGSYTDASGSTTQSKRTRCRRLEAQNVVQSDVLFNYSSSNALGILFLRRYRTTLRFEAKEAFFEATGVVNDFDHSDLDGLSLGSPPDGRLFVTDALPDSIGYKIGVRKGDEIVRLGKYPVAPHRFSDVVKALKVVRHEDQALTVVRDGQQHSFVLPGEIATRKMLR